MSLFECYFEKVYYHVLSYFLTDPIGLIIYYEYTYIFIVYN